MRFLRLICNNYWVGYRPPPKTRPNKTLKVPIKRQKTSWTVYAIHLIVRYSSPLTTDFGVTSM